MKKIKKIQKAPEIIYGVHPILESIKAKKRKIFKVYTTKKPSKGFERIKKFVESKGVEISFVENSTLEHLCKTKHHMGVAALVSQFTYRSKPFSVDKNPLVLVVDGVTDVKNLGGILRTAHCTNFDAVILADKNQAQICAETIKTSAGLAEHLEIIKESSLANCLKDMKLSGYNIYVSSLEKSTDIRTVDFKKPLCLVIGSEEKGVSKSLLNIGTNIFIPQKNDSISYNASVASGILMFKLGLDLD